MQPDAPGRTSINRIAGKEITLFFASPIAYLFLGTFAAVSLFTFFWGEAFFARNIADVRPLFEWMPILLVFLSSALTMRLWSEERRTGTLEHVLTQPVSLWRFVLGKFRACLTLLLLALVRLRHRFRPGCRGRLRPGARGRFDQGRDLRFGLRLRRGRGN